MWRTLNVSRPGAVCGQPSHKQRAVGLPSGAYRSRSGLPPIQSAQALLGRPTRFFSQVVGFSSSQDDGQATDPAGALVPTPQQQNGNLPAVQTGAPGTVPVQFIVPEYLTHWGQVLKVVGSLEELGSWKVEKAPSMQWNEGHTWTLDVQLPVGAVNFKIVMHDQPNSNTRWELGEDRSVLIPETTTVTGAPVGQVGVTCNFNDVHNSRVEVRPDRAYLKQQLKAVEARVVAIQSKKRKLDQRMSVLTDGLKKYDATVAMLADGVQAAVQERRSSKESAREQQQQQQVQQPAQQPPLQQPAMAEQQQQVPSSNGVSNDKQKQRAAGSKAPAGFNPLGRKDSFQVPILDPSQLPSFAEAAAAAAAAVSTAADHAAAASSSSSSSSTVDSSADEAQQADSTAVVAADSSSLSYRTDVSAIKASHVNETVLSATVDQLLAAAEDALARSTPSSEPLPNSLMSGSMTGGVDDMQLAEEYVEELLAAASALEQQADRRASLLLEAAMHQGDSDMAADIEQLAAAELPPIPTVEELAEAAAAAAPVTVTLDELSPAAAAAASMSSSEDCADAAVAQPAEQQVVLELQLEPQQQQQQQQQQPQQQQQQQQSGSAQQVEKDGSITFTAESLSVDVDVKQLLAAVLSRVGIPLGGQVTISATYTPNEAAMQDTAAAADAMDAAAEASMDFNVDSMAASSSAKPSPEPEQQQQQQKGQQQKAPKPRLSPIEAIAAVFSRGSSMDSEDEGDSSSSSGGGGPSNGRGQGFRMSSSSSNGASVPPGRYSKTAPTGSEQPYTSSVTAAAAAAGGGSSGAYSPIQPAVRMDSEAVARQLEAKEAARKAAAERVAAALAQVEEMRRSVVAANSLLRQQLGGAAAPGGSSGSSSSVSPSVQGNGESRSVRTSDGRVYSKYRVAYKGAHQTPAAPAADASSNSNGSSKSSNGSKPEAVSAPGASRGLPAIAATAVEPSQPVNEAASTAQQQQQQSKGVGEGMSLLAALAAEVQKQSSKYTQQ